MEVRLYDAVKAADLVFIDGLYVDPKDVYFPNTLV